MSKNAIFCTYTLIAGIKHTSKVVNFEGDQSLTGSASAIKNWSEPTLNFGVCDFCWNAGWAIWDY